MAQLPGVFNDTKASEGFSVLDAGWYLAQIIKSEIKPTADKQGLRLNFQFKVVEGDSDGRIFFLGLNIKNKSEQAMAISKRQFDDICEAVAIDEDERSDPGFDTSSMHGIPLKVKLKVVDATSQWPAKNEPIAFASEDEDISEDGDSNPF